MAWQISKRVWENAPTTVAKNDRLMLLALADCADEFGVCWPGYDKLAGMVGVDPRSAMRLVQHLESQKQIIILKQSGKSGGRGYTNLYFVVTGLSQDDIKKTLETHPMFTDKGDKIDTLLSQKKGDKIDEKGDIFSQKGDKILKRVTHVSPEPSIEPSLIEPSFKPERDARACNEKPTQNLKLIPAIVIFEEVVNDKDISLNASQVKAILEIVGDSSSALEKWRQVVDAWRVAGHKATNITGQLDWFRNGIPTYNGNNGVKTNGQYKQQRQSNTIISPTPEAEARLRRMAATLEAADGSG